MSFSPLIVQLMEALQCLPGVGPKTAQRMMLHLLERGRDDARQLATALAQAADSVGHFQRCRTRPRTISARSAVAMIGTISRFVSWRPLLIFLLLNKLVLLRVSSR